MKDLKTIKGEEGATSQVALSTALACLGRGGSLGLEHG